MTLIVSFESQQVPFLLGDLLLTSKTASKLTASTPLVRQPSKPDGKPDTVNSVTGLCQKVMIIHPHVCLAWTGSFLHAVYLANNLRAYCLGKDRIDREDFHRAVNAFPKRDNLDFIIYSWHGVAFGCLSNLPPFELDGLHELRIGGSGTEHFFQLIASLGSGTDTSWQEQGMHALGQASIASAQQFFEGVGLTEGWGGGFEMVYFDYRRSEFSKLGPICWLFWDCEEDQEPNRYSIKLRSKFHYQYCENEFTLIWVQEDNGLLYRVAPPGNYELTKLDRPKHFDPWFVASLIQIKTLDGKIEFGTQIEKRAENQPPDFKLQWSESKTSCWLSKAFIGRVVGSIQLPTETNVAVTVFGQTRTFSWSPQP
jgi:hypothetical protein